MKKVQVILILLLIIVILISSASTVVDISITRTPTTETICEAVQTVTQTCDWECLDWDNNNTEVCIEDECTDGDGEVYCSGGYGNVCRDTTTTETICTKTIYSGSMYYHNGSEFIPIDTTIVSSDYGTYDYEMEKAQYHAYFQDDANTGEAVRFEKDGYYFIYDLSGGKMQWAEQEGDPSKTKSIGAIQSATIEVNGNEVNYPQAFLNTNLTYSVYNDMLKENFILYTMPTLEAGYLFLEYSGEIRYSPELHMYAEGENKTDKDFTTQGKVKFKDSDNNTIFYMPEPTVEDANATIELGFYDIKVSGGKIAFGLRVNKTFLEDAVYPVYIDPTITIEGAGTGVLEDADFDEDNTRSGTETSMILDEVDGSGEIDFIMFSLPIDTATVTNATLCTYCTTCNANANIDVWYSDNITWKEEDVDDWCSNGAYCSEVEDKFTTRLIQDYAFPEPDNQYVCMDSLQAGVQSALDGGDNNVTFVLNATANPSDFQILSTKEGTNKPYLNVTFLSNLTISSCAVLDADGGEYELTADITNSATSNCIDITASDVILDCQGYTIDGNNVADTGIRIWRTWSADGTDVNVTIKNCTVTDWDSHGIYVYTANRVTIEDTTLDSNPDWGIGISQAHNITITRVTSSNNQYGALISDSNNSVINDSSFVNNTVADIWYDINTDEYAQTFTLNRVNGTDNKPILYFGHKEIVDIDGWNNNVSMIILINPINATINNLTIMHSDGGSIGMWVKTRSTFVLNNSIFNNTRQLYIADTNGSVIQNTNFSFSDSKGIDLENNNKDITIENVVIRNTGSDGIYMDNTNFTTLTNIKIRDIGGSSSEGLKILDSYNVTISGLYINDSGDDCFEIDRSSNISINYTIIDYCRDSFLDFRTSDYIFVDNMTATNSSGQSDSGFFLSVTDSTFRNFSIKYSGENALRLSTTQDTVFQDFRVELSDNRGLYGDSNTDDNNFTGGTFIDNANGIALTAGCEDNLFYNNIFNETEIVDGVGITDVNVWNTSKQIGTRIYGNGIEISGNYYTNSSMNGYSDTCGDADNNGFCDSPFNLTSINIDELPLSDEYLPALSVLLENKPLGVSDDLNGTFVFTDYTITENETRWYNNSLNISMYDNLTSLSTANTSSGDTWTFSGRVFDGNNWSRWQNDSVSIDDSTIPTLTNYSLTKSSWLSNEYVTLTANCTDNSGEISFVKFRIDSEESNRTMTEIVADTYYKYNATTFGVGTYNISFIYCEDISSNINVTPANLEFTVSASTTGGDGGGGGAVPTEEDNCSWTIGTEFGKKSYNFAIPFKNAVAVKKPIILTSFEDEDKTIELSCEGTDVTEVDICDHISFSNSTIVIQPNPQEPFTVTMMVDYDDSMKNGDEFSFNIIAENEECQYKLSNKVYVTRFSFFKWRNFKTGDKNIPYPAIVPALILGLIVFLLGIGYWWLTKSKIIGIGLIGIVGGISTFIFLIWW